MNFTFPVFCEYCQIIYFLVLTLAITSFVEKLVLVDHKAPQQSWEEGLFISKMIYIYNFTENTHSYSVSQSFSSNNTDCDLQIVSC